MRSLLYFILLICTCAVAHKATLYHDGRLFHHEGCWTPDQPARTTPCAVRAWVRAEDLQPNSISHGEVRVRVTQPCEDVIQSIGLQLRLDEWTESFKRASNASVATHCPPNDPQRQRLQHASLDGPDLYEDCYIVETEDRNAWVAEIELLSAAAVITGAEEQFTVVSPNVNFPVGTTPLHTDIDRASWAAAHVGLIYRYLAVINYANGTTTYVPAGYTTFLPADVPPVSESPIDVNSTVQLPEYSLHPSHFEDTSFTLNMKLQNNVVRQGSRLEGVISVLPETNISSDAYPVELTISYGGSVIGRGTRSDPIWNHLHPADPYFRWELDSSHYPVDHSQQNVEIQVTPADNWTNMPFSLEIPPGLPRKSHSHYLPSTSSHLDVALQVAKPCHSRCCRTELRGSSSVTWHSVINDDEDDDEGWVVRECPTELTERYSGRMAEFTVLGPERWEDIQSPPMDYLENEGRVPAPIILHGHVRVAPAELTFPTAEPVFSETPVLRSSEYVWQVLGEPWIDREVAWGSFAGHVWKMNLGNRMQEQEESDFKIQ